MSSLHSGFPGPGHSGNESRTPAAIATGTGAAKRKDMVPALELPGVREKSRPVASLQCDQGGGRRKSRLPIQTKAGCVGREASGAVGGHAQPGKAPKRGRS